MAQEEDVDQSYVTSKYFKPTRSNNNTVKTLDASINRTDQEVDKDFLFKGEYEENPTEKNKELIRYKAYGLQQVVHSIDEES